MKLELLYEVHADLKPPVQVGRGPSGTRVIYDVAGGRVDGPRIHGKLLASGADWLLVGNDGVGRLNVRATVETDDGAHIFLEYGGISIRTPEVDEKRARGEASEYGDAYFMTTPRFETGDERYAWLNAVVAVGEGRSGPGWVEYRVYHVVNG